MSTLVKIISYLPYFNKQDINIKFNIITNVFKDQINFKKEIINWKLFYNAHNNNDSLIIPILYEDLSNDNILIYDFVDGTSILELNPSEKIFCSQNLTGLFINSYLITGIVHGDLHCGNLSIKNNNIVLYDYGIIFKLNTYEMLFMKSIINAYYMKDAIILIDSLNSNLCNGHINIHIRNKLKSVINKQFDKNNDNLFNIFIDIFRLIIENSIIINEKTLLLFISLLAMDGSIYSSGSSTNVTNELSNYIQSICYDLLDDTCTSSNSDSS